MWAPGIIAVSLITGDITDKIPATIPPASASNQSVPILSSTGIASVEPRAIIPTRPVSNVKITMVAAHVVRVVV